MDWLMGLQDLRVREGVLRCTTTTNDPALQLPALKIRCGSYSKLVVEMRVSQLSQAQVFWTTASLPGASESASAHSTPVPADGRFHRLVFDLAGNEHWGGCLTGLRFATPPRSRALDRDSQDPLGVKIRLDSRPTRPGTAPPRRRR